MFKCQKLGLPVICTFVSHDREFVWKERGYSSVEEMNAEQIRKFNSVVSDEDTVYILGDIMLKDNVRGIQCLNELKGDIIIVAGNHDTDARLDMYKMAGYPICFAERVKINGYHFYLSHFPTLTANLEAESLKKVTINLYGHTHQITNFYKDIPFMYHVGVDSHNGYPVEVNQIISDIIEKAEECKEQL